MSNQALFKKFSTLYKDETYAQSHFDLLINKPEGKPAINVFIQDGLTVVQVVAKDRPFMTDTLTIALENLKVAIKSVTSYIVTVQKEGDTLTDISPAAQSSYYDKEGEQDLVLLTYVLDTQETPKTIKEKLLVAIGELNMVVKDFTAMKDRLSAVIDELTDTDLPQSPHSKTEIIDFLNWVNNDNFVFLGFREYKLALVGGQTQLLSIGKTGLGLLSGKSENEPSKSFAGLPEHLRGILAKPNPILLSKSSHVSPIHRPVYMDFLGVQKFENGVVVGEYRFIGLLASEAYNQSVKDIPFLREKLASVLDLSGYATGGQGYRRINHIMNTLPRDVLFQASIDKLYDIATGVMGLHDKNRLELFTHTDPYQRFVSALVYVPRHKFDTKLRQKLQSAIETAFGGISSTFATEFSETNHVRVHFHILTKSGEVNAVDNSALKAKLNELMVDFDDEFLVESAQLSQDTDTVLAAMPLAYKEAYDAKTAVIDSKILLALTDEPVWKLSKNQDNQKQLTLKIYGNNTPLSLSNVLPALENFGVKVKSAQTYEFNTQKNAWVQDYTLIQLSQAVLTDDTKERFEAALSSIWQGVVESDKLNELIFKTALDVKDILVLRALSAYMIQASAPFSKDYIHQTLVNNSAISELLIAYFHSKLSPTARDTNKAAKALDDIKAALATVKSLDEDRIVHWFIDLLNALLRTNFYQSENGAQKDRLSFKFVASMIENLPKPKPMLEIYVYSPKVEGVHLRGGKVARGGLRWSDRMEDYRTEVLGLVKAQMVKNAVIVPVGSKGGFVVKDKSKQTDRETWQAEGVACYQTYIRGLLDITDNLVDGQVVPPKDTVRLDEDDPYLVVAADKGTATFSDIANGLSKEYNFWLQDAFASGGSAGYDHKAMGITARGAWESVKRHFRLQGLDTQSQEFSVIGIGDMSGDVFGNGMLLSDKILLKAAFNHLHIFIDPNPNAKTSFEERKRLFDLPRSAWTDYNQTLISSGGGVFNRTDKSIVVSDEMKQAFAIQENALTPNELLNKLLKAPVDLIWNGGIGTYVKASDEEHIDVGDRANDAIRVNGKDIRAKVIGEGGNLGCTQKGRIEYALNGGRIYTDAIDNSGGVNCSDHEVNIKILLGSVMQKGKLDIESRNALLADMTDNVANLVLRQNYLQPQAIELSVYEGKTYKAEHKRFMQFLEGLGRLDRAIEHLPSDDVLAQRSGGLAAPECAVLLAYGKMWVYEEMLKSDLADSPYFVAELKKYFPNQLGECYFDEMKAHKLHREIICTYLTNGLINRLGLENTFALFERGYSITDITKSYAVVRDVFGLQAYWDSLSGLDNQVDAHIQIELELDIRGAMMEGMNWILAHENLSDVNAILAKFDVSDLKSANADKQALWVKKGLGEQQASKFATLDSLPLLLKVINLANDKGLDVQKVADSYLGVYQEVRAGHINQMIDELPANTHWDKKAKAAASLQFNQSLEQVVQKALSGSLSDWTARHKNTLAELERQQEEAKRSLSLASVLVVVNAVARLLD